MRHFLFALVLIIAILMPPSLSGEQYVYDGSGKRDPFISPIGSGMTTAIGLEIVENIEDIKFEGVIFDPLGGSMAMLNGEILREGDKAHNVEIVKIYNNAVVIKIYNKTYTLNLSEEGGETLER